MGEARAVARRLHAKIDDHFERRVPVAKRQALSALPRRDLAVHDTASSALLVLVLEFVAHGVWPGRQLLQADARPQPGDDLVGQSHLIREGRPIRKFLEAKKLPSILLW